MAPRSIEYRLLQKRLRRTLKISERVYSLPSSFTEIIADYFDKYAPYDSLNVNRASSYLSYGCVDACSFVMALVYIDRIRKLNKQFFEDTDPEEIYLSALIVASKYLHDGDFDTYPLNCDWAFVVSTSLERVNGLELQFLDAISWNLHVSSDEFNNVLSLCEKWIASNFLKKHGFCTYNELTLLSDRLNIYSVCVGPMVILFASFAVIYSASALTVFLTSCLLDDYVRSGGSVSGLPAIKECKAQGLDVVAFERTSDIGGLWNYRPQIKEGGTVMKSTIVNTSKEMMAYSDFPPPKHYANFIHHSKVLEYMMDYAKEYDLYKYIEFETNVTEIRNVDNKWIVDTNKGSYGAFDFVLLCTGHHSFPLYPEIKGMDEFKGKTLHAHQYRDSSGFEDQNVFIIGMGNSALDIAAELAKVAKSVTISTRRGSWIFNRVSQGGMPYDVKLITRLYTILMDILPWTIINDFMEHRLQQRLDHDIYGLRPNHRFFQQHPTISDDLPNLLCSGQIVITEDVDQIGEFGVTVKDGRNFPADVIIYATGYTFRFPFLQPQSIIPIKVNHEVELYKYVFPVDYPTLGVIGLVQPIGSMAPICEIQSRLAAAVFAGQIKLPSKREMWADIEKKRADLQRRYYRSPKHTLQVDYIKFTDEIADMIGCKPQLTKYLRSDPSFFLRLLIGANAPYVYRLNGPGSWDGAKQALIDLPNRIKAPLKNRQCRIRRHKKRGKIDEYFRYGSMKWIAGWTCLVLALGIWIFCSGTSGIPIFVYGTYVLIFLILFSFMLLWFDLQYDMTTVL